MGVLAFTRCQIVVNGVTLTAKCRGVDLDYGAELQDKTAMNDLTRKGHPGLKVWKIGAEFNQDFAAGSVDETAFPLVGSTGFTVLLRPVATAAVSDSNPNFTGTAVMSSYKPLAGKVGDMLVASISLESAGTLSRATS